MKKNPTRPSIDDLLNQISDWKEQVTAELRMYDRLEFSKSRAKDIFSNAN